MAAVLKPITLTQTLKLDSPLMEQALHVGCGLWSVFQLSLVFSALCLRCPWLRVNPLASAWLSSPAQDSPIQKYDNR